MPKSSVVDTQALSQRALGKRRLADALEAGLGLDDVLDIHEDFLRQLAPGDRITFTGALDLPRETWESRARAAGLDEGMFPLVG